MTKTDFLDIVGVSSAVLFAFAVWPPLALAVFAVACLAASYMRSKRGQS